MSRNIKEIGKELMGKSLNSFHRKTGLTQLEENNKMQDGILDGILSQVDDAYIEKTEQSNVIHLDGSGDGVVVLDSIEGNTMVNLLSMKGVYNAKVSNVINPTLKLNINLKPNTKYTRLYHVSKLKAGDVMEYPTMYDMVHGETNKQYSKHLNSLGWHMSVFTNLYEGTGYSIIVDQNWRRNNTNDCELEIDKLIILEGDWTDKSVPTEYFEGLQSSFEEKVNEQGKYEIEILSNNRNLIDLYDENLLLEKDSNFKINNSNSCTVQSNREGWLSIYRIPVKKGKSYTLSANLSNGVDYPIRINDKEITDGTRKWEINLGSLNGSGYKSRTFVATKDFVNILFYKGSTQPNCDITNIMLTPNDTNISFENKKSNKIKLLLDEPLCKDNKLCIKDGILGQLKRRNRIVLDGSEDWKLEITSTHNLYNFTISIKEEELYSTQHSRDCINNHFAFNGVAWDIECSYTRIYTWHNQICISYPNAITLESFKEWLRNNPTTVVYELAEPLFVPITNEYGEPILLEGYENGTLYIDSTIVPTTTVRYTPKMESFNVLNEVNNNNIMLTNDIDDNIIPYMMDVDLMIMEKEMALMSQYKIRRIGVKDMTSMQKRTQDMLERLIKGRTLTEQECKTRVTTYLNAGKITDAQAEELMLLISEVYA